ncbi:DUF6173 family protein [Primorskyibacter sp. 2E107]|uniref:DUF6173 family protein n=1 Tax=Primorskyibacter sp. 2E107 TaxID=3403458 RepID=UPI003AF7D94D
MDNKIDTTAEAHESDALPRRIDVHTEGKSVGGEVLPEAVKQKPVQDKSPAEWAYERLVLYIQTFEEQLDSDHEVAMGFVGAEAGVLRIEGLGYFDPDMITFYGSDAAGVRTQLVQHVSQLSVILRAMPKELPEEKPRRIGFLLAREIGAA